MRSQKKIRYAVVGLGHIAQVAVLPAFAHAGNSELTALISGDPTKLRKLAKRYGVKLTFASDQYDECLKSGLIDAVYLCVPNSAHRDYSIRAMEAGIHVLCEKPLGVTVEDCEAMIRTAEKNGVRLMTAYRLHFEEANLTAIAIAQSGKLGELRFFNSVFASAAVPGNIRLKKSMGGGPLHDIGIYCINAARSIFRSEPTEVFAWATRGPPNQPKIKERFSEVEETVSAILKFSGDRLASFTCSFGAGAVTLYQIVGTEGDLLVENGYKYAAEVKHRLTIREQTKEKIFKKRDQFAPEIFYFSDCIVRGEEPEPSGHEGLADVRVIQALFRSLKSERPERVHPARESSEEAA